MYVKARRERAMGDKCLICDNSVYCDQDYEVLHNKGYTGFVHSKCVVEKQKEQKVGKDNGK